MAKLPWKDDKLHAKVGPTVFLMDEEERREAEETLRELGYPVESEEAEGAEIVEVGEEYDGKVKMTTEIGAFVELSNGSDGLLPSSDVVKAAPGGSVDDVLHPGDAVKVRVENVDPEHGVIGLSMLGGPTPGTDSGS